MTSAEPIPMPDRTGRTVSQDDVTVMHDAMTRHVFADLHTCVCGYGPADAPDWERHRLFAGLVALSDAGRLSNPVTERSQGQEVPRADNPNSAATAVERTDMSGVTDRA